MTDQLSLGFDYTALEPGTRYIVKSATDRIHVLERSTGESIIEIGGHLKAVKEALGHGQFLPWLESEFAWSDRTARRFMQVADAFGQIGHGVHFEAKALYALASGDVPTEIREQFIAKAEAGEPVRHRDVQAAIAETKPIRPVTRIPERYAPEIVEYACRECGQMFIEQVWHCSDCDDHSPVERETCRGCGEPRVRVAPAAAEIHAVAAVLSSEHDDMEDSRARLKVQFSRGLKNAAELRVLKPEAIGRLADAAMREDIERTFPLFRRWMDDVEAALPRGLRIVS